MDTQHRPFIDGLEAKGFTVATIGANIVVTGDLPLTPDERAYIRAHKPELLELLKSGFRDIALSRPSTSTSVAHGTRITSGRGAPPAPRRKAPPTGSNAAIARPRSTDAGQGRPLSSKRKSALLPTSKPGAPPREAPKRALWGRLVYGELDGPSAEPRVPNETTPTKNSARPSPARDERTGRFAGAITPEPEQEPTRPKRGLISRLIYGG